MTERKLWRIIALITFTFCAAIGILNLVLPQEEITKELFSGKIVGIVDLITTIPLFLLFLWPDKLFLFSIVCLSQGIANLVDMGNVEGVLLYILGLSILFKEGFFRTHTRTKFMAMAFVLTSAILTKLRFGVSSFLYSIKLILFLCIVFWLLFVIFRRYLVTLLPVWKERPKIFLTDYDLMTRDYDFIKRVRNNEKYSAIAIDYKISESAIKQRMVSIYRKLGVADRSEFLVFCNSVELIFPDS